ncbi:MAG: nicotinate-nucleotide adenylyltransferase [Alphaproteobacteria bacterium]|nr:nicotinate-nucleotide adenylyltransferase [Alphaproteobacteria bacterium]
MTRGRRIGLLGGSFNPAHEGHRHVSLQALRHLGLDEVWWLVSPQNPLKPAAGMAPFAERIEAARRVARHPRIRPSDLEQRLGTRFTFDTLRRLRQRFPRVRFVWIIGADNLVQLPRWHRWQDILRLAPVAVFDRPTYSRAALSGKVAQRFRACRLPAHQSRTLADRAAPAWCFIAGARHPASATAIREGRGKKARANVVNTRPRS